MSAWPRPSVAFAGCFTALLLAVLVTSCSPNSAVPENALAQQWIDALNSHDPHRVLSLMTGDATYWDSTTRQPLSREMLDSSLQREFRLWPNRNYSTRQVIAEHDTLVIEWHLQQTHPSGEPVPSDGVTVLDVRDGKVHAVRTYFDASIYLRFLKPS